MEDQAVTEGEGKQTSGSPDNNNNRQKGSTPPPSPAIAKEDVRGTPEQLGSQNSLPPLRPDVWGVLTAISDKAKARPQGPHILLYNSEHVLGRLVKDPAYRFDSINVSGRHCTIFRKQFKADESCIPFQGSTPVSGERWLVYIKDSSSNGTFINCQKLKRDSPEARIKDGDIISLVNVPEHENAFAFLYQEVKSNVPTAVTCQNNGSILKRKSAYDEENFGESTSGDSKRVKGLGIGGLDGPVSLDDVRRLQRSNEELRNQLEAHLLTIEKLRAESRATTARHDAEIKELRETLSAKFLDQIQDLRFELGRKEKEIEDYASLCAQQQSKLEDYERSLASANQSRKDADEVMKSQKLNILELKEQLEDERNQRRNDREKGEADLKAAVERARSEASEELKRQSESAARQIKENLETINKLQETDKDNRSLIEALCCKLDDTRESLVSAERTSRSLELRLQDESALLAIARKKITEKEQDLQSTATELQKEKTTKEEALAKLAALELEMETAIRDLSLEKQRLQGARERIVLRETQLRAFHSTAEEIAALQKKQEEQLKAMMKVLEDGEDENQITAENHVHENVANADKKESDTPARGMCGQDAEGNERSNDNNSVTMNETKNEDVDDADSQTTAGECGVHVDFTKNTLEVIENGDTQMDDLEEAKDIQVMVVLNEQKPPEPSAPVGSEAGYTQVLETESKSLNETQLLVNGKDETAQHKSFVAYTQLLESESNIHGKSGSGKYLQDTQLLGNGKDEATQAKEVSQIYFQDKVVNGTGFEEQAGGETMRLEDEDESGSRDWEKRQTLERSQGVGHKHQQGRPPDRRGVAAMPVKEGDDDVHGSDVQKQTGMRRQNGPLNTLDLLASEVPGSWAYSTPGSVHCDNAGWSQMEGGTQRGSNEGHADIDAGKGVKPEITKEKQLSQQRGGSIGADTSTSQNSLSPRTSARHDKERRDLNVMLGIVAPDFSRLHGLDRVMETAPDSEEHTEEEEDEEHESDNESAESDPMSQSASVSARY